MEVPRGDLAGGVVGQAIGADLGYIGSAFIATQEANAVQGYKDMIVESRADDIVYTFNRQNSSPKKVDSMYDYVDNAKATEELKASQEQMTRLIAKLSDSRVAEPNLRPRPSTTSARRKCWSRATAAA